MQITPGQKLVLDLLIKSNRPEVQQILLKGALPYAFQLTCESHHIVSLILDFEIGLQRQFGSLVTIIETEQQELELRNKLNHILNKNYKTLDDEGLLFDEEYYITEHKVYHVTEKKLLEYLKKLTELFLSYELTLEWM